MENKLLENYIKTVYKKIVDLDIFVKDENSKIVKFINNKDLMNSMIEKMIAKVNDKKGSLMYLTNIILYPNGVKLSMDKGYPAMQYYNVSGFDLVNNEKPFKINNKYKNKIYWYKQLFNFYNDTIGKKILKNKRSYPKNKIFMLCEDFSNDDGPSKYDNNQSEFKVYKNTVAIDKNMKNNLFYIEEPNKNSSNKNKVSFFNQYIKYEINNKEYIVVNIHAPSASGSKDVVDELFNLMKCIKDKNNVNDDSIIIGGDSNIYYSRKKGYEGLTYLLQKFHKTHSILISRKIVSRKRPFDFFNNSQSCYKQEKTNIEETMLAIIPNNIVKSKKFSYDTNRYFLCTSKDIGKLSSKYVKEYSRQYWAFNGANDNLKGNIKYGNYQNRLLSDHFPIFFDFYDTRFIFGNNASLIGTRGIINNSKLFKDYINKDPKILKDKTRELMPYIYLELVKILEKSIQANQKNDLKPYIELSKSLKASNVINNNELYNKIKLYLYDLCGVPREDKSKQDSKLVFKIKDY